MIRRHTGGPASTAGPLLLLSALAFGGVFAVPFALAANWIPPPRVTALLPGATLAPGTAHTLALTIRANGAGANLAWSASSGGTFVAGIAPASGLVSVPANSVATVNLTVTVPSLAVGTSSLSVELVDDPGGGRVVKVGATILAATDGRPEVIPVPSTWTAPAGTSGSVAFQVHSLGGTEDVVVTGGRFNPDPNNFGGQFTGGGPPAGVTLPAGATLTVNFPTTIPATAYAGNSNAAQLSVSSIGGTSTAVGMAMASASLPDSLPTAFVPVGVTPLSDAATGRDGPAYLASRGLWLVPSGAGGVRVIRNSSTDSIGPIDLNGDGADDRVVGTIRIPAFAAALAIIPGFVTALGETLDVGLLAAGRGGLMLLDLRVVEDPPFGDWSDFFDTDGNGIDDRILRTIPTPGFATDAAWVRSFVSGRTVALVADADVGSNPVAADYDPSLVVAGTGAGIVAVDVDAAIDSLGPVPYAAGTLPTQGSALDLELRGGTTPEMVLADGSGGVALYNLSVGTGAPATVTFTPRGEVPLSGMWGAPDARDLAWISNSSDSSYVALAAAAGGVQIVRVPRGVGAPTLVLAQQTAAPAIGIAGAWTGTLGVAMGSGGVELLHAPGVSELDKIQPGAPAPYTWPVNLARGQSWGASGGLERARHQGWTAAATSLRFRDSAGPIPDLMVSDGARLLVLRPGTAAITAVEAGPAPPAPARIRARPNPTAGELWLEISRAGAASRVTPITVRIIDARGRLVRTLRIAATGQRVQAFWDGRDDRGRAVASGRYWATQDREGDGAGASGATRGKRAPAASITLIR
ncbi:MAG TPA: FlgD immunoglobulin-like domain containing protein [Candidatus Limnocylindrales bacterium]|nr:FlgD immunoglobulin-like domain containing protein [Candidatus Limnocylindrales bacterium]